MSIPLLKHGTLSLVLLIGLFLLPTPAISIIQVLCFLAALSCIAISMQGTLVRRELVSEILLVLFNLNLASLIRFVFKFIQGEYRTMLPSGQEQVEWAGIQSMVIQALLICAILLLGIITVLISLFTSKRSSLYARSSLEAMPIKFQAIEAKYQRNLLTEEAMKAEKASVQRNVAFAGSSDSRHRYLMFATFIATVIALLLALFLLAETIGVIGARETSGVVLNSTLLFIAGILINSVMLQLGSVIALQ